MSPRRRKQPIVPTTEMSCEDLACAARTGNEACYAELVRRYEQRLFNFLLRRTRHRVDAEDLTQETFLRAWQRLDRYDEQWRFSTWLFTIGARLAVNHHRAQRPVVTSDALEYRAGAAADPAADAAFREISGTLWDLATRILSQDQQTALWLRYAESLSIRDISVVLGKSEVATRVLLFRARDAMAEQLEKSLRDNSWHAMKNDDPNDETFLGSAGVVGGAS